MYSNIMVPVDLQHPGELTKALKTAADLAKHFDATITYVGVTAEQPTSISHNPAEYTQKLQAFADEQGTANGIRTAAHAAPSHDPSVDLDDVLLRAVKDTGCDLVVMMTHHPSIIDRLWSSHGGKIASRADTSVFLVR